MKRLRLAVAAAYLMMTAPALWAQMPAESTPETQTQPQTPAPDKLDESVKGLLGSARNENDINFREVAKDLRCPTCTGLSVLESDASFSVQIKDQVHEQMKLGKSKDEILKYFVERYGPWILREPPKEGFNLLAWGVPIALLIGGPILIWLLIWRRKVQFNAHGVRSTEALVQEMHDRLRAMKEKRG
jgi:cytochrome c-type biogenesis protein CcmH/NrfF